MNFNSKERFLRITKSGYLVFERPFREQYLTEDVSEGEVQLIGRHLQIAIRSERSDVLLRIPLMEWKTGDSVSRHFDRNGLYLGVFAEDIIQIGPDKTICTYWVYDEL